MFKRQTLRGLVNERLAVAAVEIFALFERTIAEYEEELSRCKKENQRKQRLQWGHIPPKSPPPPLPDLNQDTRETAQIKEELEEQIVKQEEEQLPVSVSESLTVCVKTEQSSLPQQRQTEHMEETVEEDISSEPEGDNELSSSDNDKDGEPSFSCTDAQMETETDGDNFNRDQIGDRGTAAQNPYLFPKFNLAPVLSAAANEDEAKGKKHQCSVCDKKFGRREILKAHYRIHTGERLFSCPICWKTFTQKCHLQLHMRTHTSEKPYSCLICQKTFARKDGLTKHERVHTGEKPYSCLLCNKVFTVSHSLKKHMKRIHTEQKLDQTEGE